MELGLPELIIILVLVLVLFGSSKLPALGEGLGKAIRGFKTALNEEEEPAKGSAGSTAEPPRR